MNKCTECYAPILDSMAFCWPCYDRAYPGNDSATTDPRRKPSEIRVTDPKTGGQKGKKPEAYAMIPAWPLSEVARVYGHGAEKYAAWNWIRGYDWSLSISALQRHIEAFRARTSHDTGEGGSNLHHLAHACFHLFALMEFERLGLGTDDRQPLLPGVE